MELMGVDNDFSVEQTQQMLDAMTINDQQTYINLEYLNKVVQTMQANGQQVPFEFQAQFQSIRSSYTKRQEALRNSRSVRVRDWVDDKITRFKRWLGLGAIPLIPVAVASVVSVGATIAVYYALRPHYSESKRDLKVSEELKNLLAQTDPQTAQKIKDDLEKQIDDAFNAGNRNGTFDTLIQTAQTALVVGIGIWAFTKVAPVARDFLNNMNQKAHAEKG